MTYDRKRSEASAGAGKLRTSPREQGVRASELPNGWARSTGSDPSCTTRRDDLWYVLSRLYPWREGTWAILTPPRSCWALSPRWCACITKIGRPHHRAATARAQFLVLLRQVSISDRLLGGDAGRLLELQLEHDGHISARKVLLVDLTDD
jgi:hypothetical protein